MTRTTVSRRVVARNVCFAALTLIAGPRVATAAETQAFVYATDFSSGSIAAIAFGPPRTVTPNVATVSSDAVLRHFDGLLYVINRFGFDNIQVLDPSSGYTTVRQFSVGNGSNPHDIVFVSRTKAYVPRYGSPDLWIVNPQTGAHTGTISLAQFADAAGIPEMDRAVVWAGRVFITVERLDRNNFFLPTDSSQVIVIDPATDTIVDADPAAPGVQGILLPYQNPNTKLLVDTSGMLVVGCSGYFGIADGGVVRINPATLTVTAAEITEAALGGDINDVALFDATRGYAVVSDASFNTLLKAYDRDAHSVTGTPFSTAGFYIADTEINDRAELWLCDRTPGNPGVRVFSASTGTQLTSSPLNTGLPPQNIAFDDATTVDVPLSGDSPAGTGLTALRVLPNPVSGVAEIRFHIGGPAAQGDGELAVYDASGRLVASRRLARLAAGEHAVSWDGHIPAGPMVPAGLYFVRVRVGPHWVTARLVRL